LAGLHLDELLQDELNHPSLFMLNRRLRKHAGYPVVSIVHLLRCDEDYPAWQKQIYRQIESLYLSSVDGFIFNSADTRQKVEGMLAGAGVRPPPYCIAYPGGDRFCPGVCDDEIRHRAAVHPLRVLFTGNVIPRKGLHVLLDALAKMPAPIWKLTVAGNYHIDPAYTGAIYRQVQQNGLSENVHFSGVLSDSELSDCMMGSHLLVMPSFYEGFGIVYLEGMGFGLPAIGTSFGAAKEIIAHGHNGFLIQPGDAVALANHLSGLAQDRSCLLKMSLAARESYRNHPTWDESMHGIRSFLASL
jgi:glycosyltransferase involved in cell wall biosynthesis